ncbi:MAG TPA: dihydrofolate reductase [Tahibacter sp.]|nr:dihydrofolate reductase [Tahibacter sp.]
MSAIGLVAAVDRQLAIGRRGDMPWHLPDDLRRFKRLTLDKPVLMGRKTALSIGRALPGRRNLVLSRAGHAPYDGQTTVRNLEQAVALAGIEELMVIGGGEIYALALPLASRLYLTHVDCAADDADTFFPAFDRSQWRVVAREAHAADARHEYAMEFVDYVRM